MTTEELKAARPQALRLKQVARGLRVGKVLGARVLVKPVTPWTELDDANQRLKEGGKGILYVPDSAKADVTPRASTGLVIQVGDEVRRKDDLLPGTAVMFHSLSGGDYRVEGIDLKLLDEREILCTIEAVEGQSIDKIMRVDDADEAPEAA